MSNAYLQGTSGDLPPEVATTFITNPATGTATPAANTITFAGVGGTFSAGGSTVTFTVAGSAITWTDKALDFTAVANNGYFSTAALIATMPAAPSQGDIIFIISETAGTVTLQANTGQSFRVGTAVSALAGTCVSSAIGDAIEFVYRAANSTWYCANSPQGTWTTT